MGCDLRSVANAGKPYFLMTMNFLTLAVYVLLLKTVLDPSAAVSAAVIVLYEHTISASMLFSAAILFERKAPLPSFPILCWAFFVGFLQVGLGQLLMTASLRYIAASFQSAVLNTIPAVVFALAVISGRERFSFMELNSHLKLLGIVASAAGATVMVVLSGSGGGSGGSDARLLGFIMLGVSVVATAFASLFLERVAMKYPYDLTLAALMNASGAIQIAVFTVSTERNPSSWKIRWSGSLQLFTILYGGIVTTGVSYGVMTWCIRKKGPVFGSSFSPLLIVFSFVFETVILGKAARIESIVGSVFVAGGLYLLLWAKSRDHRIEKRINTEYPCHDVERSSTEPLLR